MLSAHFAPAIITKAYYSSFNLYVGMGLCMLPDILHFFLALIRVEKLRFKEIISHSFLVVFLLSLICFVTSFYITRSFYSSLFYAICIISHFIFDLVNRSRMRLTPWGPLIPGLGLHERFGSYCLSLGVEGGIIIVSCSLFAIKLYNGNFESIYLPLVLMALLLISEVAYYHIYAPIIEEARLKWK